MSATCGRNASSSGGENGTGMFGGASRATGASRCSKAFSAIIAADLGPDPEEPVATRTATSARDVFSIERSTVSSSSGYDDAEVDDLGGDAPPARFSAASSALCTIAPYVIDR